MTSNDNNNNNNNSVIQKREFFLVCYLTYEQVINNINLLDYKEYAFIYHDKDLEVIIGQDKPHWHVYLNLKKKTSLSKIAALFGISENLIEFPYSKVGCLRYLVHANDAKKYQYEASEIYTNINNIEKTIFLTDYDENQTILETYINLLKDNSYTSFSYSIMALCKEGYSNFVVKHSYLLKLIYDDIYDFRHRV